MESSPTVQPMTGDNVSIMISQELAHLPKQGSEYCIYRVHDQLRMANAKAYDPEIISVGPYHRGKGNLEAMEQHKLRYLLSLLERKNQSVEVYVEAIRSVEDKARKCYADLPELKATEFLKMLVVDGCFIVELLRKFANKSLRDADDPIFKMVWIRNCLQRDLLLFENQLPFFVLLKLFRMIEEQQEDNNFRILVMNFFSVLFPGKGCLNLLYNNCHDHTKHLLGMIHDNWLPSFAGTDIPRQEDWRLIHCATELKECGVKFEKADGDVCLHDIEFKDGKMRIPPIVIEGRTECLFRNLIAYEEYSPYISHSYVISYVKFLDCLIHSEKDVEMLCHRGIIKNWLGDEKAVSEFFNKINHSVTAPGDYFHYGGIFNEVNAHCHRKENRWMANLKAKYLNSPWTVISILAAFALLVLSLIQTIVAVLSYKQICISH